MNFAVKNKMLFFTRIDGMKEAIHNSVTEVRSKEKIAGLRGWLNEEQINELSTTYCILKKLKI